jgi:hypothetical protein
MWRKQYCPYFRYRLTVYLRDFRQATKNVDEPEYCSQQNGFLLTGRPRFRFRTGQKCLSSARHWNQLRGAPNFLTDAYGSQKNKGWILQLISTYRFRKRVNFYLHDPIRLHGVGTEAQVKFRLHEKLGYRMIQSKEFPFTVPCATIAELRHTFKRGCYYAVSGYYWPRKFPWCP